MITDATDPKPETLTETAESSRPLVLLTIGTVVTVEYNVCPLCTSVDVYPRALELAQISQRRIVMHLMHHDDVSDQPGMRTVKPIRFNSSVVDEADPRFSLPSGPLQTGNKAVLDRIGLFALDRDYETCYHLGNAIPQYCYRYDFVGAIEMSFTTQEEALDALAVILDLDLEAYEILDCESVSIEGIQWN